MPTFIQDDPRYPSGCMDSTTFLLPAKNSAYVNETFSGLDSTNTFDAQFLQNLLDKKLANAQVIVVSNRQPFHHTIDNGKVRQVQPASGLVTALEPIVRACAGTWIAHGGGVNDKDFVDDQDRCPAPLGKGAYTLRRVWISAEELRGYCDGFSNSGLWPLSHMAHVRPILNESDWLHYVAVNRRFANAVVQEARNSDPIVLVQDYHLSLVPALVRAKLPRATIISFWHIPWPHPDQMSMCPWLPEILHGLLGSDVIGLQTPQHVRNFIDLVNRHCKNVLTKPTPHIIHKNHVTQIRDFPISIAWPALGEESSLPPAKCCRVNVGKKFKLPENTRLIIGVDRFDYTKGLIERLHGFEALLIRYPHWQGNVRFIQVASPTRVDLKEYTDFQSVVYEEVKRINRQFAFEGNDAVTLLDSHHEKDALNELYRAADICLVTSLHDGMNLVCKEFVAARTDEQGVLVLSQFAGAANEMTQALIVNPYHTLQIANSLDKALCMPAEEQTQRMRMLRSTVRRANVFKWAADMLEGALAVREPAHRRNASFVSGDRFHRPATTDTADTTARAS